MGSQPTKNNNQTNKENVNKVVKSRKDRTTNTAKETEKSSLLKKPQDCKALWDFRVESEGWWIQFLYPIADDIYVWCGATKIVSRINTTGQVINTIALQSDFDHVDIEDVCVSPLDNTIWFCCGLDSVHQVDTEGQSHKRFRSNGRPFSLCVTQTGSVVVAMMGKIDMYSKTGITIYSTNFEIKNVYIELNKPCKIKECPKTRRVVYLNDKFHTSSIILMDDKLKFQWMFDGALHTNSNGKTSQVKYSSFHDFKSYDVSFDGNGNLFIADVRHACVLELDMTGNCVRTFADGRDNGLELYCVHIIRDKTAIVGYRYRQIDKRQHIVKRLKYK